jgi:hypothetical protein
MTNSTRPIANNIASVKPNRAFTSRWDFVFMLPGLAGWRHTAVSASFSHPPTCGTYRFARKICRTRETFGSGRPIASAIGAGSLRRQTLNLIEHAPEQHLRPAAGDSTAPNPACLMKEGRAVPDEAGRMVPQRHDKAPELRSQQKHRSSATRSAATSLRK